MQSIFTLEVQNIFVSNPISSRKSPIGVLVNPKVSTLLTNLFLMFLSRNEAWIKVTKK